MRLRNKKTGEVVDIDFIYPDTAEDFHPEYSLKDFIEEWEDYGEPKEFWCIGKFGNIVQKTRLEPICGEDIEARFKQIGNYFGTKEEAEKAVEKLKAWKRLKDKGLAFNGWNWKYQEIDYDLDCTAISEEDVIEAEKDLELLFGEEGE